MRNDFRFAFRRLRATPAFLITAALTLALGMGANALMFSAANGLLRRPLPFHDADNLVWVLGRMPDAPAEPDTLTSQEAELVARRPSLFARTAGIGDAGLVREVGPRHDRWLGLWATRSLFDVLHITPALGAIPSTLPPDGAPRAIFISHERWTRDFNSDSAIAGRTLAFADNKSFVIAGVLPPGVEFPFSRAPHKGHGAGFRPGVQDFWILAPDPPGGHPGGVMIARLAAGRDAESARAEVTALASQLPGRAPGRAYSVTSMRDHALGLIGPALPVLQLFSLLVLVIACANLANLMLARAAAARTDTAMRIALGASRRDLVRLQAVEAFIVSACGAAAGLALAWLGREMLAALAPRHTALVARLTIDGAVMLFLGGTAVLTTLLFGVIPGIVRGAGSLSGLLSSARHTGRGTERTLRWLAVSQIGLSLALLAAAAALHNSLQRLINVDAGYRTGGVITAETLLYIPNREATPIMSALVDRLEAQPYVEAVGFVHSTPLTGKWPVRDTFEVIDGPGAGETPSMPGSFVSPGYFAVMRIPVLAGRAFEEADTRRADYPIVINDIAARQFFPGRNPIGARVRMTGKLREIVGVVKATRDARLDAAAEPQWYQPIVFGTSEMLVRVSGDPAAHLPSVRREIEAADPRMIIQRIVPLDAIAGDSILERRMASSLVSAFACMAIALAAVGLFGMMHFGVLRRRRELAIRSALGATRARLLRGVLARSLFVASAGIAIGIALSLALAGSLRSFMFETVPASAGTLALASALMLVVALAAAFQPAWRAAAADPAAALKPES